jgi:hypothetical protein
VGCISNHVLAVQFKAQISKYLKISTQKLYF